MKQALFAYLHHALIFSWNQPIMRNVCACVCACMCVCVRACARVCVHVGEGGGKLTCFASVNNGAFTGFEIMPR